MILDNQYEIIIHPKVQEEIDKKLKGIGIKKSIFDKKLGLLKENPNYPGLQLTKLVISEQKLKQLSADEAYEFYLNMQYRIVIYVNHQVKEITVAGIFDHDEINKKF